MQFKKFLYRKLVEYDLIPCSIRWKKSVSGIGRIYSDSMEMMRKNYGGDGVKKLSEVMYEIGFNQSEELIDALGLERNPEGCAYALLAMHRIFGIRSRIVEKSEEKVVIRVTYCQWGSRMKGNWTPQTCASISRYENGLVEGINQRVVHTYTKRRTQGKPVCELVLKLKKGDANG